MFTQWPLFTKGLKVNLPLFVVHLDLCLRFVSAYFRYGSSRANIVINEQSAEINIGAMLYLTRKDIQGVPEAIASS